MNSICTIYRREMRSYFSSPIAYIFICAFLILLGVFFFLLGDFFSRPNPDLRSYFWMFSLFFVVLIPTVTMRLWSEEKKTGTIELLMTFPIKSWQVVLGKFLAGYTVIALTCLLTLSVPLSVSAVVTGIDWGVVLSSYIGALLIAAVYIAVGAWVSALTQNQIVALLVSIVLLFMVWGIGFPQVVETLNRMISGSGSMLGWFGANYHYETFIKGQVSPVAILYCGSLTAFFLILNNFAVEWRKY